MSAANPPAQPQPPVAAELVSAAGAVHKRSLQGAFAELVHALEDETDNVPYGVIVTSEDDTPTAAQVWQACLNAWKRIVRFLERTPPTQLRKAHWSAELDWPQDLRLVSPDQHRERRVFISFARSVESNAALKASVGDVYLLLTRSKLEEMLPTGFEGSFADERLLIQVKARLIDRPREHQQPAPVRDRDFDLNQPAAPADASTLAWRQWFIDNVRCLTAADIARECGHQARNTSATASRWTGEGKIFCVRHGGQFLYPAFQFRNGHPHPLVARILHELGSDPTGWDQAFFFATPNANLAGDKPMERLNDNTREDELVRLAYRYSHPADVF